MHVAEVAVKNSVGVKAETGNEVVPSYIWPLPADTLHSRPVGSMFRSNEFAVDSEVGVPPTLGT